MLSRKSKRVFSSHRQRLVQQSTENQPSMYQAGIEESLHGRGVMCARTLVGTDAPSTFVLTMRMPLWDNYIRTIFSSQFLAIEVQDDGEDNTLHHEASDVSDGRFTASGAPHNHHWRSVVPLEIIHLVN